MLQWVPFGSQVLHKPLQAWATWSPIGSQEECRASPNKILLVKENPFNLIVRSTSFAKLVHLCLLLSARHGDLCPLHSWSVDHSVAALQTSVRLPYLFRHILSLLHNLAKWCSRNITSMREFEAVLWRQE